MLCCVVLCCVVLCCVVLCCVVLCCVVLRCLCPLKIFSLQDPPKSTHNGILRGYYVNWRYQGATTVDFRTHKVTPATTRKLRITGLIVNSRYEVKIQMYNDAGAGPFSDLQYIKTKEGGKKSSCLLYQCHQYLLM